MPIRILFLLVVCGLAGALAGACIAAEESPEAAVREDRAESSPRDEMRKEAEAAYEADRRRHADNPDMLVLPGLLADRRARTVTIRARATGLPRGEPMEFFLIPADSGKDYEALAVAFVKPSDVDRAIRFIGLTPGRPINYAQQRFWAKGPRLSIHYEWDQPAAEEGGKPQPVRVRAERLAIDTRSGKPMPFDGFIFTGSFRFTQKDERGVETTHYAADVSDSRSIISSYNESTTVIDVPMSARQGVVYGFIRPNPDHRFEAGQPVRIVIAPLHADAQDRLMDLSLEASLSEGDDRTLKAAVFSLAPATAAGAKPLLEKATLAAVLERLDALSREGRDVYLTVRPDPRLTLGAVRQLYGLLDAVQGDKGIRMEPAPPGHLHYSGFFPHEDWPDRSKRLGEPWELHVARRNGGVEATLIMPRENREGGSPVGFTEEKHPFASPEELARTLAEKSSRWAASVFIFAPSDLSYGELLDLVRPSFATHPEQYIFLDEKPR